MRLVVRATMSHRQVDGDGRHMVDAFEVVHAVVVGNVGFTAEDVDDGAVDFLQFSLGNAGHSWHTPCTSSTVFGLLEEAAIADHDGCDTLVEAIEESLQSAARHA